MWEDPAWGHGVGSGWGAWDTQAEMRPGVCAAESDEGWAGGTPFMFKSTDK